MDSIEKLLEIMNRLRDAETGCPWDQQQTFASVAPYTVEEAYEVADAIARNNLDDLRDELGDLLFQVVFHSRMAAEEDAFDFDDVAVAICNKLVRRHPHVFGDEKERASGQQPGSWERIKAAERGAANRAVSAIDGVAKALPALKRAGKLGKRAASVGFDWPDIQGVRDKVIEELDEFTAADNPADRHEELGDLLFSAANLARHAGVDPEQALADANRKFERRFRQMEAQTVAAGQQLDELSLDELEQAWQQVKKHPSK